ncbi:MAG: hypothetical protein JJV91_01040 [Desulfosarcina sp.]|nr:hypothetical protein [Desulfobacterales bacterium]
MLLFAEEKSNSIYSLSLDNTETIYHVIGGGEKNIGENEFRNFRKYRISSSLNNIVSIENFGFIAGESATNNWFAILLPNAIKEKKTSNLCQKYVPHASFSDDYSS